jgi:prephenate dehydratase
MMRVAFQGAPGAYSQAAIWQYLGPQTECLPCETFEELFSARAQGGSHTCPATG